MRASEVASALSLAKALIPMLAMHLRLLGVRSKHALDSPADGLEASRLPVTSSEPIGPFGHCKGKATTDYPPPHCRQGKPPVSGWHI